MRLSALRRKRGVFLTSGAVSLAVAAVLLGSVWSSGCSGEVKGQGETRVYSGSTVANRTLLGLYSHSVNGDIRKKIPSGEWPSIRNLSITVKWASVQPNSKTQFDWGRTDLEVNRGLGLGLDSIMMTVDQPVPGWAQNPQAKGDPAKAPPKKLSDFENFCYEVAKRYKSVVKYWQVWQEPGWDLDAPPSKNGIVYFSGYADQQYAGVLRAAYKGLKAADPNAYVASGALMNGLSNTATDYVNYDALISGRNQDVSMKVEAQQPIVAERPMYFDYQDRWDGGHDESGVPAPGTNWYLAEGCTYDWANEWICIQNPNNQDTNVTITYMFPGGATQKQTVTAGANSRVTVNVNAVVGGGKDVSARITSGLPIVIERPMYFNYNGAWTGGSVEMGVQATAPKWYLAEGTTQPGFQEWISLMNPEGTAKDVDITYMFGGGATQPQHLTLGPTSRQTVNVNSVVGNGKDVSATIVASGGIIVERPMYFDYQGKWTGGDTQVGSTSPGKSWFLAEGTTRNNDTDGQFDMWISIQNPGDTAASVNLTYMFPGGANQPGHVDVGPHSRATVNVNNAVGPDKDVSVKLTSTQDIIVERPMYFNYHNQWTGGTVVLANQQAGKQWYFAEGTSREGFQEWLTLQNPNATANEATITFMFADGTTQQKKVPLPPNSRSTLSVNNAVSIAGGACDAVAVHPYLKPVNWKDHYNEVRNILDNNGFPNTEVVVTEIGAPHSSTDGGYSPQTQAEAIDGVGVGGLWSVGCKKIWIYQDVDDPAGQQWYGENANHGLFDANGNAMPAWGEFKKWQTMLPNYTNLPTVFTPPTP